MLRSKKIRGVNAVAIFDDLATDTPSTPLGGNTCISEDAIACFLRPLGNNAKAAHIQALRCPSNASLVVSKSRQSIEHLSRKVRLFGVEGGEGFDERERLVGVVL